MEKLEFSVWFRRARTSQFSNMELPKIAIHGMMKSIKAKAKAHCDQLWKYSDLCCNYDPTLRPKFADLAENIGQGPTIVFLLFDFYES